MLDTTLRYVIIRDNYFIRGTTMDKIALVVLCVGLTYLGFEYDSFWAFAGAFVTFMTKID